MSDAFRALAEESPAEAAALLRQVQKKLWLPHAGQRPVLASPARFRVVRAGRRWGKTKLSAREAIRNALAGDDRIVWWVANEYKNVRRGYRNVLTQLPPGALRKAPPPATANDLILEFRNGSRMEFYSGGNPDALAGEGVDFIVIDEAALIADHVWFQLIRPTLMDAGGRALIISTPRGQNWFHELWGYGADPKRAAYASWHYSSYDNPHIPDEEIDELKESLPSVIFRQEVLAEFLGGEDALFNLEKAVIAPELVAPLGHIFMGVDLAKHQDFTVLSAARDTDRMPVYYDRFNTVSWPEQQRLIVDTYRQLGRAAGVTGVTIAVDSTGLGDVIFDNLDELGLDVIPINFSTHKDKMVRRLGADVERQRAILFAEMEDEFSAYEIHAKPSGRYEYHAPEGQHDDKVSAKMLEHWALTEGAGDVHVPNMDEITPDDALDEEEPEGVLVPAPNLVPDTAADIMEREAAWG